MQTEVLIIGGGLAGCATAYYLAREGVEVTLVERYDLNTQASGCNAGSIHAQIPHEPFLNGEGWARDFAPTIPIMVEFDPPVGRARGGARRDLEVSLGGGILVAETTAQMRDIERKAAVERAHGLGVEMLSRADLRRVAPYVAERMVGGAFCATEGKANPLIATPAFARAALRHGAQIRAARAARPGSGGRGIRGRDRRRPDPRTPRRQQRRRRGRRIAACSGSTLPIEGHPIQVNVTEAAAPLVEHLLYFAGEKLTLKQARKGALLIGGGWPARRARRAAGR